MINHLLAFISSHGINDFIYPLYTWFPIYSITIISSILVPLDILNSLLIIGTIEHFSHDMNLSFYHMSFISLPLLNYRENRYIQNFIIIYLGFIHTPLAYYKLYHKLSLINYILNSITYYIVFNNKSLTDIIEYMIYFPGKEYKNIYLQKLLLGIINSHIILHFIASNDYYNLNM